MIKFHQRIEIVSSSRKRLSSMSKESREAIQHVLSKHYRDVRITLVDSESDLEALAERKPDLVFLGMKYVESFPGTGISADKIWVSSYLEVRGIACTGSGSPAHQLEMSKPLAKKCVNDAGLDTSPFYVIEQQHQLKRSDQLLEFPLFIKPANRGGGQGIDKYSVVHNFEQLESKVESITSDHSSDSLVETFLNGCEFSVAILKDSSLSGYSAMPIELIAAPNKHGVRMLGSEMKSSNQEVVAEVTNILVREKINTLALNVFKILGGRDYGRIDIRMDTNGTPYFLEANLIPSLIDGYGSFPKACMMNKGLDFETMLLNIVRLGFERAVYINAVEEPTDGYDPNSVVYA